jgi:hypothetical protein
MRPVLLLEINEVPLRLYRKYAADPRFPHIRELVDSSQIVETLQTEEGELSPWCTWPTLHRGLTKKDHGIYYLGQDPATYRGTPIWEDVRSQGHSVGVFGSLQSWPPRDPGAGGFYVPDTFSPTPACIPSWIEPIQALNLGLVRENGRVMSESLGRRVLRPSLFLSLLRSGVRPRTLARAAAQLVRERFDPAAPQRRVSFQALLFWDIFRRLYDPVRPPAFTTFFTNHIASVEHRYWNHVFPEDFEQEKRPRNREHLATMDFAMQVLDEILAAALAWRKQNPKILLLVANSMGQGARVTRKHHGYELMFEDVQKLFRALGIPEGVKQNLAMAPQICFDLGEHIEAERFIERLGSLTCRSGRPILLCDRRNQTITVTVATPPAAEIEGDRVLVGGKETALADIGMTRFTIEAGTAYHVPEGEIFVVGLENGRLPAQMPVPAHDVKRLILEWSGLPSSRAGSGEKIPAALA